MLITIVIPCYRSAKTIERVVAEARAEILKREGNDYQFVLVNDCSPDNTLEVLRGLAERDERIVVLDMARNYGQNTARISAVPYIEGDMAICMDDDGQHPADQIYRFVDKINEGYDLVYAKFSVQRQPAFRRFTSHVNTALLELTGAKQKGISNSPFLAWSRFAIDALKAYRSPFVSAGAYLMKCTNRVTNIEMEQRSRMEGRSGYTLKKLINLWLTEFTNFSQVPLRLSAVVGMFSAAVGVILAIIMIIRKIINPAILAGYASTMSVMLIIGGIIMLMLGLLGEYIGKIYMTISGQPQSVVRTVIRSKPDPDAAQRSDRKE